MKNKIFLALITFISLSTFASAENLLIEAKNISLDKKNEISTFEKEVIVTTENGSIIKSDYAKYDKKLGILILKNNIKLIDKQNNVLETNSAKYNENNKVFQSNGFTKIITPQNYILEGSDLFFYQNKNIINSNKSAKMFDAENNKIYLDNFEYLSKENIFKSIGKIMIKDKFDNSYNFSQIYIDTKKKEIVGTDSKVFMNNDSIKIDKDNKPRIFSNSIKLNEDKRLFKKSIFTLCDYRKDDKCPPWSIQASEMLHDNKKKTIFYKNAVIKVYNIPVLYIPKLSHPDPTVDRRSGFLIPSFSDTKNLGSSINIPYFFAVSKDKNFTLNNRIFGNENPLFTGQYHQVFKNSDILFDVGHTEGYKTTTSKKRKGSKSHFFSKYTKNFFNENNSKSFLDVTVQKASNDKYLKLYKVSSDLVDFNQDTLENSINFTHENEDLFFGLNMNSYENLKESYNDKYEFILPELTLYKNLISNNFIGDLDLQSNLKIHNYDTNKLTKFFVNDFNWNIKEINHDSGIKSKILGKFKNINYENKNIDLYKDEQNHELFGALGYSSELNLRKNQPNSKYGLVPKMLLRYSPGSMRKETSGSILTPLKAFSLDRLDSLNNFETGLSATLGFDFSIDQAKKDFNFSVAQIFNKKENKKMDDVTSLNEKLSDVVASSSLKINENINLNYDFSIDQNYKNMNYNSLGTSMDLNYLKVDFDYLQEQKHVGNQEYFKTKIGYAKNDKSLFSFETKRNLINNSSEYYNLSYEYLNDCLRAGLVFRREFYNDSEIEPENSLMFKITLTPFGNINSPSFNK
jgi:LPS-assembly protein